jgi:hypothetical protein
MERVLQNPSLAQNGGILKWRKPKWRQPETEASQNGGILKRRHPQPLNPNLFLPKPPPRASCLARAVGLALRP